jgi:hypothetical protein
MIFINFLFVLPPSLFISTRFLTQIQVPFSTLEKGRVIGTEVLFYLNIDTLLATIYNTKILPPLLLYPIRFSLLLFNTNITPKYPITFIINIYIFYSYFPTTYQKRSYIWILNIKDMIHNCFGDISKNFSGCLVFYHLYYVIVAF